MQLDTNSVRQKARRRLRRNTQEHADKMMEKAHLNPGLPGIGEQDSAMSEKKDLELVCRADR